LTGTCYNFKMEEFFSSFLRRAGMPESAGLSCFIHDRNKTDVVKQENQLSNGPRVYQCSPFLVQVVNTMQLNIEGYQAVRELQQYAHCSAAVTQYQTVKGRWTKGHNQHGNI